MNDSQKRLNQVQFIYPAEEKNDAEIIRRSISTTMDVLNRRYGLQSPADCRVILMTGWQMFLETGAPGLMKLYLPVIKMSAGEKI